MFSGSVLHWVKSIFDKIWASIVSIHFSENQWSHVSHLCHSPTIYWVTTTDVVLISNITTSSVQHLLIITMTLINLILFAEHCHLKKWFHFFFRLSYINLYFWTKKEKKKKRVHIYPEDFISWRSNIKLSQFLFLIFNKEGKKIDFWFLFIFDFIENFRIKLWPCMSKINLRLVHSF